MASKDQKFKKYSPDFKETILKQYFDGVGTPRTLSLKYDVPFKTIKNWIGKIKMNIYNVYILVLKRSIYDKFPSIQKDSLILIC